VDDAGPVEAAVNATLDELDSVSPVRGALAETARALARSIDRQSHSGTAASGMATAAASRELRTVLDQLSKAVSRDEAAIDRLIADLSAPIQHEAD
jgi:hypothetical protein